MMSEPRCLDYDGLRQQIFLELLRNYHNGTVAELHPAYPQEEVAYNLSREAGVMTKRYYEAEMRINERNQP